MLIHGLEDAIVISIPAKDKGMQQKLGDSLDRYPVTIKLQKGQRERLRSIAGWRDKLRVKIKELIQENDDGIY